MKKVLTPSNYEIIPLDDKTNVRFYTSSDTGSYVPPHWHDSIEIIYLLEGTLKINTEGNIKILTSGQCTLIDAGKIHSTLCMHPNTSIVFQIPLNFLKKFVPEVSEFTFFLDDTSKPVPDDCNFQKDCRQQDKIVHLKSTLKQMKSIMDTQPDGALLLFNQLLFDILYQLYQNFSSPRSTQNGSLPSRNLQKLEPVLHYINAHYNRHISLGEISKVAMFDSKYFCRFFKKCMGITFLEYQNEIRISRIYQDLISTDDKILDILERHGFTNYKLFRRIFQEHFNSTPSGIRNARARRNIPSTRRML